MQDAFDLSAQIVEAFSGNNMSYAQALRKYEQEMIPRAVKAVESSWKVWTDNHPTLNQQGNKV